MLLATKFKTEGISDLGLLKREVDGVEAKDLQDKLIEEQYVVSS